jgi:nucleotide-binding universal stress UspA family protein
VYQRLIVPLDGSKLAEAALPVVESIALAAHSTVVLLHVLERGAPSTVHGERHLQAEDEAAAYLKGLAERFGAKGIPLEAHAHEVPEGDVARSIVAHVSEQSCDLIVLCTHGSGGVRDLLYGSIAQQVLKRGAIPVLLVRAAAEAMTESFAPKRVLVPLDGTAGAEAALTPAEDMARLFSASLHIVMVVATPGTVRSQQQALAHVMPAATRVALELERSEAQEYLDAVAEKVRSRGVKATTEVRRGNPTSALADEAAEPGVGLVVVATHGRAGVQAIWAGSVTARLLSRTRAPLLLLRSVER